ncbi:MAG: tRNA (adenosine(37)-N6)-threonylcarbamoyltransferase complex ATPase subunit type 1 TsaE [Ignavibacteria bacterium CG_4_8_14_3_um_filter_37_9]|nr:tRNA (adenosine(37)-N6)-threonylcarbamoyltransferase complex ATPase subunit type 1 TsaE [Ignavibacteria bacterium]OIO16514.1 MAG: tRNA (adenosine(37)-N6)-threonylcarbamoyltransferase complex ATPase subunit type 1 TsaE [Ignavibacteria bacterium CG1_02_37_35]PIP76250.1 MAG: tRNA (adenosine(37)-N6)-threonylcarbamoyltransferase complex ATPase subunit type 1 TsaE [Ignavibacteria bacterium CG22_combo_CG10-13_8_21_14_all_37_15]PIS46332.1 MAG: tRNA (adenosine(37)-N6)-threonylcarbamoyltransferase comp
MQFPFVYHIFSEEETIALAKSFAAILQKGDCVALTGNLGTGKTFFVKALCKEFLIDDAKSPTFALLNVYSGKEKFFHFDFYRVRTERELLDIGFHDYLNDEEAISLIEWADLFPALLPKKRYEIVIMLNEDFSRTFNIKKL